MNATPIAHSATPYAPFHGVPRPQLKLSPDLHERVVLRPFVGKKRQKPLVAAGPLGEAMMQDRTGTMPPLLHTCTTWTGHAGCSLVECLFTRNPCSRRARQTSGDESRPPLCPWSSRSKGAPTADPAVAGVEPRSSTHSGLIRSLDGRVPMTVRRRMRLARQRLGPVRSTRLAFWADAKNKYTPPPRTAATNP